MSGNRRNSGDYGTTNSHINGTVVPGNPPNPENYDVNAIKLQLVEVREENKSLKETIRILHQGINAYKEELMKMEEIKRYQIKRYEELRNLYDQFHKEKRRNFEIQAYKFHLPQESGQRIPGELMQPTNYQYCNDFGNLQSNSKQNQQSGSVPGTQYQSQKPMGTPNEKQTVQTCAEMLRNVQLTEIQPGAVRLNQESIVLNTTNNDQAYMETFETCELAKLHQQSASGSGAFYVDERELMNPTNPFIRNNPYVVKLEKLLQHEKQKNVDLLLQHETEAERLRYEIGIANTNLSRELAKNCSLRHLCREVLGHKISDGDGNLNSELHLQKPTG